jgi:hypothetical protein
MTWTTILTVDHDPDVSRGLLEGEPLEWPEGLRVREMPAARGVVRT